MLAAFVQRVMKERGLTLRDVALNSGTKMSHSTVANIAKNQQKNIGTETLKGLARGLGVSESEIFDLVKAERKENEYREIVKDFIRLLSSTQDYDIDAVLPMLAMIKRDLEERLRYRQKTGFTGRIENPNTLYFNLLRYEQIKPDGQVLSPEEIVERHKKMNIGQFPRSLEEIRKLVSTKKGRTFLAALPRFFRTQLLMGFSGYFSNNTRKVLEDECNVRLSNPENITILGIKDSRPDGYAEFIPQLTLTFEDDLKIGNELDSPLSKMPPKEL